MSHGFDLGIAGRAALVCGSSEGLGKESALALARAGVQVAINGRDEAKLKATAAEIEAATKVKVTLAPGDVTTEPARLPPAGGPADGNAPGEDASRS